MTLKLDPAIAAILAEQAEVAIAAGMVLPARGDALTLREMINALFAAFDALPAPDVIVEEFETTAADGHPIGLRWHTRGLERPGSAVAYVHGGGLIAGTIDHYQPLVNHYVQLTGVPFLSIEYRLAPEYTGETPASDAFAGIQWLFENAEPLGVDGSRIAVMGDSGGGCVAAGAAILARDHAVALAKQVLIYPMLDDRNMEPDDLLAPTATWTYDFNFTGWNALLGDDRGTDVVSPVAAPARLTDFNGLAPAYIEVGELDIFRDESVSYAQRFWTAGVSCELHVHPDSPHGHDTINFDADVSKRSFSDRARVLTTF